MGMVGKNGESAGIPADNGLGTEALGHLLLRLALPSILAQVVNLLYNLVDRVFVGRIPDTGALALAGVGVAFPVIMFISAFASLVGMGGAPRASMAMGRGDRETAERILGSALVFLLVTGVLLFVLFFVSRRPLLHFLGASSDTIGFAEEYLTVYLFGTLSVQLTLGLNQYVSCQGFAKVAMATVCIGAVLNIVLDPLFIYCLDMGCKGAALATICSQSVSAVWIFCFFFGRRSILRLRRAYLRLDRRILLPVLALGMGPFILQSTECLVPLTLNAGMQYYGNDAYVSAMTILFVIAEMLFLPVDGLCQGAVPIMSYNFGAGNAQRVSGAFRLMAWWASALTFAGTAVVLLFPRPFIALFTSDTEVVRISAHGARLYMAGMLFSGIQLAIQRTFLALGQAKLAMCVALLRKLVLLIPLALLLPRMGFGTDGLFVSESVADVLSVAASIVLFVFHRRRLFVPASQSVQAEKSCRGDARND